MTTSGFSRARFKRMIGYTKTTSPGATSFFITRWGWTTTLSRRTLNLSRRGRDGTKRFEIYADGSTSRLRLSWWIQLTKRRACHGSLAVAMENFADSSTPPFGDLRWTRKGKVGDLNPERRRNQDSTFRDGWVSGV